MFHSNWKAHIMPIITADCRTTRAKDNFVRGVSDDDFARDEDTVQELSLTPILGRQDVREVRIAWISSDLAVAKQDTTPT